MRMRECVQTWTGSAFILDALIFCWCANLIYMFSLRAVSFITFVAVSLSPSISFDHTSILRDLALAFLFCLAVSRPLPLSNQINCCILFVQSLTAELVKFNFTCKILANYIFDHFADRRLEFIRVDCIHSARYEREGEKNLYMWKIKLNEFGAEPLIDFVPFFVRWCGNNWFFLSSFYFFSIPHHMHYHDTPRWRHGKIAEYNFPAR